MRDERTYAPAAKAKSRYSCEDMEFTGFRGKNLFYCGFLRTVEAVYIVGEHNTIIGAFDAGYAKNGRYVFESPCKQPFGIFSEIKPTLLKVINNVRAYGQAEM